MPVVVVPLPILEPDLGRDLPAPRSDDFTFLFMFDFHSTVARKNPLGLIEAYAKAFGSSDGARLVVKTFNGDHRADDLESVRAAAACPDVEVVDRYVSLEERDRMLADCDCYVSLHRSEGFGLTLGEAALGRPVVTTGFSGSLDLVPPGAGYLVRWSRAPVGPGGGVPAGGELVGAGHGSRRRVDARGLRGPRGGPPARRAWAGVRPRALLAGGRGQGRPRAPRS